MTEQEKLDSLLFEAVALNKLSEVQSLLDTGANVNVVNMYGFTNLYYAASNCKMEMVQLLVSRGADPNLSGNPQTLKDGAKPLHGIARAPIKNACYPIAEFLIAKGADVNSRDNLQYTPLHDAAFRGNSPLISILLRNGADVNLKGGMGRIPLHNSAYKGDIASCKKLVEAGSDVNSQDANGKTTLHIAAEQGHPDICQYLIQSGADVEAEDQDGNTPLHAATRISDRLPILILLYEMGANPFHKNKAGQTALDMAKGYTYSPEIAETLEQLERRYRKKTESRGLASLSAASHFRNYRPGTLPFRTLPSNTVQGVANFLSLKNTIEPPARGASAENRERFRQRLANRNARLYAARQAVERQHAAKEAEQLSKAAKEGWFGFMGGARQRRKTRSKKTKRRQTKRRQ